MARTGEPIRVRCARCGHGNPADARFCNACGARLAHLCAACGHANAPGSRFCSECGRPLAAGSAPPDARFASPEAYTPRHLAEKILASRHALEGERKHVTVLFADMKGSMELLAERDPEEARRLLDPVLERMMSAVHRYEGTVNQVMGDGIMALFGAPLALEDHAVRACCAALAMQREIRRHSEEVRRLHGVELQTRVGLNSGEVVVRTIGSDLSMDYSAVGQTTHLAARMEQLATPGTIRLTAGTLRLAEGFVHVTPLGPVPVKGLADPVEVFELVDTGPARTRLQAAAVRGLTRFVGRDAELDQLRRAWEKAGTGRGQVAAIVGEPGVGKSRLVWEFLHSHRFHGWLVLESSSVSYSKASAYLPVIDLLKAYFGIDPPDDARRVREKVTGRLLTLDEALRPALPALLALLDVPVDAPAWQALDPAQRRHQTVEAVKRLLLRESQVQPLCVVFEDLHWIDAETQTILDALVDGLPTARLLLLVNYRPEYRHGWGNKTYYSQLRLDPLPVETAGELLRALIGSDPALDPLTQLLIARTEGNPLFLEESVRMLVDGGVLSGARGACCLARPLESIQVPATVQAVLASRIDRLPADEKALLQKAAVIGNTVPLPLLQAIADAPEDALRRGVSGLQAAEFIYETSLFPEFEYTFKHALTHEVVYASLLQEQRRVLHGRIVAAFETLFPDRVAERADWLAHHAFRGEVWEKALKYMRYAGRPSAPSLDAVQALGGPESAGGLWWTGDHEGAMRVGMRDLAVGANFHNFELEVVASLRLGQVHHSLGRYAQAADVLRRVIAALAGDLLCERCGMAGLPSVFSRSWLALSLGERGEFADGIACGEEGLAIAERAEHPYSVIVACAGLGSLYLLYGDIGRATVVLERGLVLDRVESIPLLFPLVASPLGSAYASSGRVGEALPLLEQAVEQAASTNFLANHALRLARVGEAYLAAGLPDRASEWAERALRLSVEHRERGHEAHVRRLLGEIAAHGDPPDGAHAEARFREALALAQALDMRPLTARCYASLGALYRRLENGPKAEECLGAAADLAGALGMQPAGIRCRVPEGR